MNLDDLPPYAKSTYGYLFHEIRQQAHIKIAVPEDLANKVNKILDSLLPDAEDSIDSDHKYYRARIHSFDQKKPYKPEEMKAPPLCKTSRGRIQHENNTVLYTANTVETAVAEVRPMQQSKLSIATFAPKKQNKLRIFNFDFARHKRPKSPGSVAEYDEFIKNAEHLLSAFEFSEQHFSKQVHPDDPSKYLDTIFIAQVIQEKGFDGIAYRSLLNRDGVNYAFFDQEKLDCEANIEIREVTSVEVKSKSVP